MKLNKCNMDLIGKSNWLTVSPDSASFAFTYIFKDQCHAPIPNHILYVVLLLPDQPLRSPYNQQLDHKLFSLVLKKKSTLWINQTKQAKTPGFVYSKYRIGAANESIFQDNFTYTMG